MRTVAKIIQLRGGLERLRDNSIRLENPPYMRLVIEHVGTGPRGMPAISVAHYYEQNGDLMRDLEMVFEVNPDDWRNGDWEPLSYRQDSLAMFQQAVLVDGQGRTVVDAKAVRELKSFARQWDRNIAEQGFLTAAQGGGQ